MKKSLTCWCDFVTAGSFFVLIFMLPGSTAAVEITSSLIITAYFVKRMAVFSSELKSQKTGSLGQRLRLFFSSFAPPPNPFNFWLGLFLIWNALSIPGSVFLVESLKGFVFQLFQAIVLFWAFCDVFKREQLWRRFGIVAMTAAGIVGLDTLIQALTGFEPIRQHSLTAMGQVTGTFAHPNDMGAYFLIMSFPAGVWLGMAWLGRSLGRAKGGAILSRSLVAAAVTFSLVVVGLGVTYSRGAWIGWVLGVVVFCWLERRMAGVFIGVTVLFFIGFYPQMVQKRNVSFLSDDVARERRWDQVLDAQLQETKGKESLMGFLRQDAARLSRAVKRFGGMGRVNLWGETLSIIRERPFWGIGLNTFIRYQRDVRKAVASYPHNGFLQIATETGIPGLIFFVGLIIHLFVRGVRKVRIFRQQGDLENAFVLSGLLAGLAGFLFQCGVDTQLSSVQNGNLFWIFLAATAVLIVREPRRVDRKRE